MQTCGRRRGGLVNGGAKHGLHSCVAIVVVVVAAAAYVCVWLLILFVLVVVGDCEVS